MKTRREALKTIGVSAAVAMVPSLATKKPTLTVSQLKRGKTYTKETILIQPGDKLIGMKFNQCEFIGGGAVLVKGCEFLVEKERHNPNNPMVVVYPGGISSAAGIQMGPNATVTHCRFGWVKEG